MLGIDRVPELYVSRAVDGPATAYSVSGDRSVVVLNADLFVHRWTEGIDWLMRRRHVALLPTHGRGTACAHLARSAAGVDVASIVDGTQVG